jgi:hypothetical protein
VRFPAHHLSVVKPLTRRNGLFGTGGGTLALEVVNERT